MKQRAAKPGGRAQRLAEPLGADFFNRSVHAVARELIGCRLFFAGCGGTIVSDASGVFINGKPMARMGDAAGCGGK